MKVLCCFTLLMTSLLSRADSFSEFKAESRSIVQSLLRQGIKQVGNINLEVLDQQLSEIKWNSVKDKFLLGSVEQRSTSIYLTAEKTVIVNELSLELIDRDIYPQASLHEGFGALGYDDERSKLSLSFDQIAQDPSKKSLFEKHLQDVSTGLKENRIYESRSGGTSVGGGGDGTAIEFKKILLDIALRNFSEGRAPHLEAILDSDIEPNWSAQSMYDLKVQKQEKGFRIDIPSVLWVFYGKNQENGKKT